MTHDILASHIARLKGLFFAKTQILITISEKKEVIRASDGITAMAQLHPD